jgi:endonuclease-3
MTKKDLIIEIAQRLEKNNNAPETELTHSDVRELLIAVCLSAQTTDKKVNQVTPELFKKYPTWESLASANLEEVTSLIRQVNFHKGKAERLIKAARFILDNFRGEVPKNMDDLIKIPGVARKSANVILNEAFNMAEGIVVDTHVSRVSNRLGLTQNSDPKKIEKDLMEILPKDYWRNFSGNVVLLGRYVCKARKPECDKCVLNNICPSAFKL